MTLAQAMTALEKAGSAQTRKTYARHGATGPMFGVSFAVLKELTKRIGVDHALALALWDTGNLDARTLAAKVVDPARMTSADLDRWARESTASRTWGGYVAMVAAEGPHARQKAERWLAAKQENVRCAGWAVVAYLAQRDAEIPDSFFEALLATIERSIHDAPNVERANMNLALIAIGCRGAALRKAATAAAKRMGKVEIDHGDTSCKTPDAAATIEKTWAHATSKGHPSPAALERTRETPRLRC
jgi:3-methyladenine DNA glycosylase AlkD